MLMLKVTGEKQGWIKGSCMQKGQESMIDVESWSWGVVSPRDPASGLALGKRQHRPINFHAQLSKASPLLAQALCTNENLTEVVLSNWKQWSSTGAESLLQHHSQQRVALFARRRRAAIAQSRPSRSR